MEVRPGYKQTEVGVMPEDWEVVRFLDIADKSIPWSIFGGPFGSNLKASDYTIKGVRIIQLQNIGDGRFHDDYAIYTSEAKANELLSNNIYPGEIIMSKMGDPVARACFVPNVDSRYLMASDGIRLAVNSRRFNKHFVHDYINSAYFRKKAIEASTGSTRQRIGLVELKQLPFVAPPLPEQSAIAGALEDVDALVCALEKLIAKKRDLKQAAMQQLLTGQKRLPGFTGKWEAKQLGEIGSFSKGRGLAKGDLFSSGTLPAIPYTAIYTDHDEIIHASEIRHFAKSALGLEVISSPHLLIASSSNMLENIGKATAFTGGADIAVGGDILLYKTSADVRFLSYLLSTRPYRKRVVFLSQGRTIRHVYASTFQSYEVALPSAAEQTAIAEVLSDMDAEIATLEQRLAKTHALKQGMMQELLTGRTRLI